jgi:hypothetical protein
MKKFALLLFFTAFSINSNAQATKLDSLYSPGNILHKRTETLGAIKGCYVRLAFYTNIVTQQKGTYLMLDYDKDGVSESVELEKSEVELLISTFNYIFDSLLPKRPFNIEQVMYSTKHHLLSGCMLVDQKWIIFMQINSKNSNSLITLSEADTKALIAMLKSALPKL